MFRLYKFYLNSYVTEIIMTEILFLKGSKLKSISSFPNFLSLVMNFFTLPWLYYLHLCTHVRYVSFNTNLNLYSKKNKCLTKMLLYIIHSNPNFGCIFDLVLKFNKSMWVIFGTLFTYIISIAVRLVSCILSLVVFQIWCHWCTTLSSSL